MKAKRVIIYWFFLSVLFGLAGLAQPVFANGEPCCEAGAACPPGNDNEAQECRCEGPNCNETSGVDTGVCAPAGQVVFCGLRGSPDPQAAIARIVDKIANWLLYITIIIASLMILIGVWLLVQSQGQAARAVQGKAVIRWAVIGLGLALLAKIISAVVVGFFD